jgi:hypothetical protein
MMMHVGKAFSGTVCDFVELDGTAKISNGRARRYCRHLPKRPDQALVMRTRRGQPPAVATLHGRAIPRTTTLVLHAVQSGSGRTVERYSTDKKSNCHADQNGVGFTRVGHQCLRC